VRERWGRCSRKVTGIEIIKMAGRGKVRKKWFLSLLGVLPLRELRNWRRPRLLVWYPHSMVSRPVTLTLFFF
jgi:hypothetical protein